MALLTDRDEIRRLLQRDPVWAAYALGDLGMDLWPHTCWHLAGEQLALVLRAYSMPILWASGDLLGLADEVANEQRYSVQVRPSSMAELGRFYDVSGLKRMWRMTVEPGAFRPSLALRAERLGEADVPDLVRLYQDGEATGESPEFFFGPMVSSGVFFGVRDAHGIAAVAGTHLVARDERVATIGNVYTRRDCRGQGLATQAATAVTTELLRLGMEVIALNAYQSNAAAIHIYEGLGFRRHCDFVEGIIERRE